MYHRRHRYLQSTKCSLSIYFRMSTNDVRSLFYITGKRDEKATSVECLISWLKRFLDFGTGFGGYKVLCGHNNSLHYSKVLALVVHRFVFRYVFLLMICFVEIRLREKCFLFFLIFVVLRNHMEGKSVKWPPF